MGEIIAAGKSMGELGPTAMLCVAVIVLALLSFRLWRDAKADSKEAAGTYIDLLKSQFTDFDRRKDLFGELGKAIEGQAQATRDLRQEVSNLRSDIQRRVA